MERCTLNIKNATYKIYKMKLKLTLLVSLSVFSIINVFGQISMSDSSAQIVGYWSVGDTQSYDMSYEKYKVKGEDTTARMMIKYEVDITVRDSTESSYTIEWFYKNYDVEADSELVQEFSKVAQDLSVMIKTDEFGAVEEVLNWEEVRDAMDKGMKKVKRKLKKTPGAEQLMEQTMAIYSSKDGIESNAIKDALQFYTYHGGVYILNEEVKGNMQFANNFGGDPFDVDVTLNLDELNEEDDNSVIRMFQSVNSEQLSKATYEYLAKLGTFGDKMPNIEDLPPLTTTIQTASRIHGSTGWTTYSIETKEVKAEGTTNIEERIIAIK